MVRKRSKLTYTLSVLVVLSVIAGVALYAFWQMLNSPEVTVSQSPYFYVRTGYTAADVEKALISEGFVNKPKLLHFVLERKGYTGALVEPGKYRLRDGMSLLELANVLRGGYGEEEVRITFHLVRTLPELAGRVARHIEPDSAALAAYLLNSDVHRQYGFDAHTFKAMFLPDTYFSEWDIDAPTFVQRMAREYEKFWNDERRSKAAALGLSPVQVATLASIVQAEQSVHTDEQPVIARLYLNRLERGMKLQSDPTVVYATGDFSINRVLTKHLAVESAYNTYLYEGLPPGPINVPSKGAIDAVLNPDQNSYLFMCAKADLSGRHAFAASYDAHARNAVAFRKALDQRKIFR